MREHVIDTPKVVAHALWWDPMRNIVGAHEKSRWKYHGNSHGKSRYVGGKCCGNPPRYTAGYLEYTRRETALAGSPKFL